MALLFYLIIDLYANANKSQLSGQL